MNRHHLHSGVAPAMRAFLDHQRALGKRFESEESTLKTFDRFLADRKISALAEITPRLMREFVQSRPRAAARSYNLLLSGLRRWFDWLVSHEHLTSSPLQLEPRRITGRKPPFLFRHTEARQLIALAAKLHDHNVRHRGLVYPMIFTLIYGLGLRVSEAANLRLRDIDWHRGVLAIEETKFLKSRLVPVGPKLLARLRHYIEARQALAGRMESSDPLFSLGKDRMRPIRTHCVSDMFQRLCRKLGVKVPSGIAAPRLHCLRHSFAVNTLLRWYRQGINPQDRLLQLSTFMGHVHPSSTAVYLTITAELLDEANDRFRRLGLSLTKGIAP